MTERIGQMLELIRGKKILKFRRAGSYTSAENFKKANIGHTERVSIALREILEQETPVIFPWERILFWRSVSNLSDIITQGERLQIRAKHFVHESGRLSNLCPDYASVIKNGLLAKKKDASNYLAAAGEDKKVFYQSVINGIDSVLRLTEKYGKAASNAGMKDAAEILGKVPAYGAETFREALQSLRVLHYAAWCEGNYHNTLGRFDQYMYPYFQSDIQNGVISEDEAFELLEEFFLCLNKDSDLYPGIQQGDNGQSMMLGGVDRDGKPCFNRLSELCLEASRELKLIDPKINLRVDKNTPLSVYEKGTLLTREGLGFPQYSNDDVVIPGLVRLGYGLQDAREYTVAACWEFIIPAKGMEIPNIAAVNFPQLISDSVLEDLESAEDYDEFFDCAVKRLNNVCREINESTMNLYILPAPFLSALMDGCVENGRDISEGAQYNNYGYHGVGLSTAVDSLYVIKKYIFQSGELSKNDALQMIRDGGADLPIFPKLRYEASKFGDGDEEVDGIAVDLLNAFGGAVENLRNGRGGRVRAGTGSAMFYLWYADNIGNTLSGHRKGEYFSANYAPELFVRSNGPLSVIRSFTKPDLTRTVNGGPLTMEFHSGIFRGEENIGKVASLIKAFVRLGGHQLQLNSVNRDTLLAAQKNPEQYGNLIVRVWGWSAYFTSLDKEYQDHVISRQEFQV